MATTIWEGGAEAIAQVDTITITGTWAADDTATIICGNSSVTFTVLAGSTAIADVHAGLLAAWNASEAPECAELTAGGTSPALTLTTDTAGVPFTVTVSETTAGDGSLGSVAHTTVSSGPNDALIDANWSEGTEPSEDDVVLENSDVDLLYNLDQITAVSYTQKASFTGHVGLPRDNANGYREYRPQYLTLGTACVATDIGQGEGTGSGLTKLTYGNMTAACAINVYKTGTAAESGIPSLLITTGTQSSDTTLTVNRGDVGVAYFAGETAVIDTLTVGYMSQVTSDASVVCGSGVTLTTINKIGGDVSIESNVTSVTQDAGEITIGGAATCGTLTIDGGTAYYESSGALTTMHVTGVLDFRRDGRSRTVTNSTIYSGGAIYDDAETVTWSNDVHAYHCGIEDVTLRVGKNITLAIASV